MNNKIRYAFLAVLLACFTGCIEEMDVPVVTDDPEYICFSTGLTPMTKAQTSGHSVSGNLMSETQDWLMNDELPDTKGAPMMQLAGAAGVTVYQYDEEWQNTNESWDKLTNAKFDFQGNNLIGKSEKWSRISCEKIRVYTYAPYMENLFVTPVTGEPKVSFKVDSSVKKQIDLIAAFKEVNTAEAKGKSIGLAFDHVLTAIRFRAAFDCTVKSVSISGVYGSGEYIINGGWNTTGEASCIYEIGFDTDKNVNNREMITEGDQTLMLIPQILPDGAKVTLTYVKDGEEYKISASLAGRKWEPGKMITYSLYEETTNDTYKYFDLDAGDVLIDGTDYKGYVYVKGEKKEVTGKHYDSNIYYVYQSTGAKEGNNDKNNTGWADEIGKGECRLPAYEDVEYDGKSWADYITDNSVVEDVIHAWDNKDGTAGAVRDAGRTHCGYRIHVSGKLICNLTIDNIYSRYHDGTEKGTQGRTTGTIAFVPSSSPSKLIINMVGDSRVGCVHYANGNVSNELVFEGLGSITVADANYVTQTWQSTSNNIGVKNLTETSYMHNHWNSAIGNSDSGNDSVGIIINSGVVYAGTTKAENCTAIGGGGNGKGYVTINGGTVTAVATTTGTAIGGGIGFNAAGGIGKVTITGGNVYAYNHSNRWDIPSSAIGGAGSSASTGTIGTVVITGGNVYAQSALGTAIGGGSSKTLSGGEAKVTISGGNVIARSVRAESGVTAGKWIEAGAGIGGGSGCTGGTGSGSNVNGGTATIRISGNPVIKTGSIGGGKSGHPKGNIGSADIEIGGGDIQAQFVMAGSVQDGGSFTSPKFKMTGGIIRNSSTKDGSYYHIVDNGGAVYMEDGSFEMSDGTISECYAEYGGAIYIKKGTKSKNPPSFKMSGGKISRCSAGYDGGAVYLEDGTVEVSGNATTIEFCSAGTLDDGAGRGGAVCVRKTGDKTPSFTMSGGNLLNNLSRYDGGALHIEGGSVTLSGGKISRNVAEDGNGGGISINSGSFTMAKDGDAVLNANSAHSHKDGAGMGGGVYVTSVSDAVSVNILSGSIIGNTSSVVGGGIAVDMSESTVETNVIVGDITVPESLKPDISGNLTLLAGGGLYVNGELASIEINSGQIINNQTSGYVDNPDVVNSQGMVTLNGGNVRSVNVFFYRNENPDNPDDETLEGKQRIVIDTNNKLVTPGEPTRNGYKFKGWNTRRDGRGTAFTDGQTVKRSTDLNLYAIWVLEK